MKTLPITLIGTLVALAMVGCTTTTPSGSTGMRNACLPEAMIMQAKLRQQSIKSKVVAIRYSEGGKLRGHAVVVFPCGNNLAAWDSTWGSVPIGHASEYAVDVNLLGRKYLNKTLASHRPVFMGASVMTNTLSGRTPYAGL